MIREFWVENSYSINERQTLNFEAKGNTDSFASVMVDDKVRLNKIAILYGANASGKSNILYALQTVFRLLVTPKSTRNKKIVCYHPFALAKGEPTKMGLSFYVNGIRYDYEISYNEDYILSETLNFYPKGYKASFYTREFVAESSAANITFGTSAEIKKKAENTFVSNTLNNHTVLSTYAKVAFDDTSEEMMIIIRVDKDDNVEVEVDGKQIETTNDEDSEAEEDKETLDESLTESLYDKLVKAFPELAETEELFKNSLHPYTQSLLSAVPMPDPQIEKQKKLKLYI